MPRYFFDIDDGERSRRDDEGSVLGTVKEAHDEAVGVLAHIARDSLPNGEQRDFIATVRDDCGRTLFRAKLSLETEWLA